EAPTIFGTGEATRDFTHVDNIVHANILATTAPNIAGMVMNIATGTRVSVNDLVGALNRVMGKQISPNYAPPRAGDIIHSCADVTIAKNALGFDPIIGFEDGLRQIITP
ncbi:MAG: GDP-mannose 4,6-dehydratase, partial [Anaerolineae bacterium]|nr:GDP-mannose 4,6-dehydratase [Anaerolineae bacterium]